MWQAYLALTKPRVIRLLLVTTVPTMILAAGGWPGTPLVLSTMIGGALAAGSASAYNMFFDRDIDRVMERTRDRPLVTGELSPRSALSFASILLLASLGWLLATTNLLATALTALAVLLYVGLYTLLLKRRTDQNIIWGGSAGCMPVLIGWAAVTGSLASAPFVLFLLVFLWTPAHYWPLALTYSDDYADAGVPMLSVTREARTVARRGLTYTIAVVALAIALVPLAHLGWVYLACTAVAGGWFLAAAVQLLVSTVRQSDHVTRLAMRAFHASIAFLAVVFIAIAVDPFLVAGA